VVGRWIKWSDRHGKWERVEVAYHGEWERVEVKVGQAMKGGCIGDCRDLLDRCILRRLQPVIIDILTTNKLSY
jgi:hypothetical protein